MGLEQWLWVRVDPGQLQWFQPEHDEIQHVSFQASDSLVDGMDRLQLYSNNVSVFTYNAVNVTNELVRGIHIQFNKKTALSFVNSYDMLNNRTYENYITLHQNLHCWNTRLEYRTQAKQWRWDIMVIRF